MVNSLLTIVFHITFPTVSLVYVVIDLLEDGEEYKFNIKQADANMENTVERTLAKYYSQ
jgi:hypothetical protein